MADDRTTAPRRARDPSGPMHASLRLGRVAGVEIGVNWSWLVIFGLIAWSLGAAIFPETNPGLGDGAYAAMAAVAAVLFFVSLLLHELGHAVVARREGMEMDGIVLWLFGGVAKFKGLFPSAGAELRIALAGPAVSLTIGVTLLAASAAIPLPSGVDGVVAWLGSINIVLLVFNMLPALPLDGGRVLRAVLWQWTGDFTRATRSAAAAGRGFGVAMIVGGLAMLLLVGAVGGLWLALIGWFLTAAARAEASLATLKSALANMTVADAMATRPTVVPAELSLSAFVEGVFTGSRHAAYPVVEGGSAVGLLGFRDLAAIDAARWPDARIAEVARPLDEVLVLSPDDDLGSAAMELAQDPLGRALVCRDGDLAGLLSMTDVSRLIELRGHVVPLEPSDAAREAPPRLTALRPGEQRPTH